MKIKTLIITLLAAVCAVSATQAQRVAAFDGGEKLTYVISYKAAVVPNSELAEVVFRTTNTSVHNTPAYKIYANARVLSQYRWFYDLDDTYETWLDKNTLKPIKFSSRIKEGKYRYKSDYTYDWDAKVANTTYRNLKRTEDNHKRIKLSDKSMDALAIFYNLRCEDIQSFSVGSNRVLELLLDDTIRKINYKYLGKEEKSFKGIGKFKTLKFSCQLATSTGESFEDGSEFFLWVSDDKNKIPVYIESPIKVGSIRGTLRKWEGLKYPLDSKVK